MPRKGLRGPDKRLSDADLRCSRLPLGYRGPLRIVCSVPCPIVDGSHSRIDGVVDGSTCGKTT